MINKYAEIQDRILLYNACKGILRVKVAQMEKDAWLGAVLSKIPAALGYVGKGLSTVGKYVGTAGKAIGSAAAPVVNGLNTAAVGLNKLAPAATGVMAAGTLGMGATMLGSSIANAKTTMNNFGKIGDLFSDDEEGDAQAQAAPAAGAANAANAAQPGNPYPNDEGIDNSDLPPGLDMDAPDVILALLANNRPITKKQRAIVNKYLAAQQGQQAAPAQQPAAPAQQAAPAAPAQTTKTQPGASTNPALYANKVTNPAQGQM